MAAGKRIYGYDSLIGRGFYNPSAITVATAGSSWGYVDATNLRMSLTVPPSGTFRVMLSALFLVKGTWTSGVLAGMWGVDAGGGILASTAVAYVNTANQDSGPKLATAVLYVTGQTPGAALTLTWMHTYALSSGASITSPQARTTYGQDATYSPAFSSPAVMEAWAA